MLDAKKIKFFLSIFKGLELGDLTDIFKLVKIKSLKAGEIYMAQGHIHKKVAFIKEGLIRVYLINEKGDEITTLVRWEDQFIASHDNILFNQPSRFFYQAIESTTLLEVDFDIAQLLAKRNPKYEEASRYFLTKMLGEALTRVEYFVLMTPQERYLRFIKDKPEIINRIPDKYIASLLGITPVSLSRIRKRISKKQY